MQTSEDILSFYHMGPRHRIYVVRLGIKHPDPLSYLSGPIYANLIIQSFYARHCLNLVIYRCLTFCVPLAEVDLS